MPWLHPGNHYTPFLSNVVQCLSTQTASPLWLPCLHQDQHFGFIFLIIYYFLFVTQLAAVILIVCLCFQSPLMPLSQKTEFSCIPLHPGSASVFFLSTSHIIFHFPLSSVLPPVLRVSVFLPVLLALLTGFSKWPSEAAGLLPGAFGDLPCRHTPLSTLSSYGCLSLLLLLYKF